MSRADNEITSGRGRGRRGAGPGAGACRDAGESAGPGGGMGGGQGGGRYRRAVLEVAILSTLAGADLHGYDLVEHITDLAGDLVCIDSGTMYRMLRGMEQEGLATSSWQTADAGPSRRVYTITQNGLQHLKIMTDALSSRAAAMEELAAQARTAIERAQSPGGGS